MDCFLVDSLCQIGEFEYALDTAMDMIGEGLVPTLTTMENLVNGLVSVSKVDDARELVERESRTSFLKMETSGVNLKRCCLRKLEDCCLLSFVIW